MKKPLIVTDLDGTLLNEDEEISAKSEEAIKKFKKNGGLFSIATGRTESTVSDFVDQLEVDIPVILYNGARIVDPKGWEVLHEKRLIVGVEIWEEFMKP